ncbi:MAG: hypothetical protein ICV66_06315 [Chitinophagaceae bacterium]|nr:hypothetical protein [Chitinophagaceae bacterium]
MKLIADNNRHHFGQTASQPLTKYCCKWGWTFNHQLRVAVSYSFSVTNDIRQQNKHEL